MHRLPDANTVKYGNSATFASCITVQLVTLLTTPPPALNYQHIIKYIYGENQINY